MDIEIEKIVEKNRRNIWKAVEDYGAYTSETGVLEDITDKFVDRLARDNAYAKMELRQLFRTSPVWNEELDALVINGTRTHNPDYERIRRLNIPGPDSSPIRHKETLVPAQWKPQFRPVGNQNPV